MHCQSPSLSVFKISLLVFICNELPLFTCLKAVEKPPKIEIVVESIFALIITVHEMLDVSNVSLQILLSVHFCLLNNVQLTC